MVKGASCFPFWISREGVRWFLGLLFLSCLLLAFSKFAAGLALLCGVLASLFFRVPRRVAPQEPGFILSPADGKIVAVDDVQEDYFLGGMSKRISIFLSILDVHMNYAPVDGVIDCVEYRKGQFRWAFEPKASDLNENQRIGISGPSGRLLLRQIAGAVARRIVLFKKTKQPVKRGEIIGMIRFGSRVEIYIPASAALKVRVGERVAGGLTVLAHTA